MFNGNARAERLAQIKRQESGPRHLKAARAKLGRIPRRRRRGGEEPHGLVVNLPLAIGGTAAIAMALYAMSPANEAALLAAAQSQPEPGAADILDGVSETSALATVDGKSVVFPDSENDNLRQFLAAQARIDSERDRRFALSTGVGATAPAETFEVPADLKRFINEDGTLTELTKKLMKQIDSGEFH